MLAAVSLVTYRRALTKWLAGPAKVDPKTVIAAHFGLLSELGAPARTNGDRPTSRRATATRS